MRVGDAEREEALRALGEHMSAGRLDLDEYGERSAQVSATKTFGDLLDLFKDLPQPHPRLPEPPPGAKPASNAPVPSWQNRPVAQRVYAALVPLSAIVALLLFFTLTRVWFVFLLPAVVIVLGGAIFGDDWNRDRHEWKRHKRHQRRDRWEN
jgi:hypothetical protein